MKLNHKLTLTMFGLGSLILLICSDMYYSHLKTMAVESFRLRSRDLAVEIAGNISRLLIEKTKIAKTLATSNRLITALQVSNSGLEQLSPIERDHRIAEWDNRWKAIDNPEDPFIRGYLDNLAADRLTGQEQLLTGEYGELFLTNRFGALVAATSKVTTLAHGHKYWWRGSYVDGRGSVFLDDRGYDDSAGAYVIGVVVPVLSTGGIIGILKSNLNILGSISPLITAPPDKSQTVKLVRTNGTVVYEAGHPPLSTGIHFQVRDQLKTVKSGSLIVHDNGHGAIIGYAPVPITTGQKGFVFGGSAESIDHRKGNTGQYWFVVTEIPLASALTSASGFIKPFVLTGLFITLILGLTSLIMGNIATRPIIRLANALRHTGNRHFDQLIDITASGEIKQLVDAYNQMIDQLRETTTSRMALQHEVGQRKRIQERLYLHKHITSTVSQNMAFLDPSYRYQLVNDRYSDYFGVPTEQIINRTICDFIGEKSFNRDVRPYLDKCLTGQKAQYSLWVNFPAKGRRYMEMNYYPHVDTSGKVAGIIVTGMDITRRKRAQEKQQLSEIKFRTIFDSAPIAIAITDVADGRLVDVNQKFCELTLYTRTELIGKTATEMGFYSALQRERFRLGLIETNTVQGLEMKFRIRGNSHLTTRMYARVIFIDGRPHALTMLFDITRQKRLETMLTQARKMEAVGTLAGGIAHDFNNLLSIIMGNLALARIHTQSPRTLLNLLDEGEKASILARDLVHGIMTLADGDTGERVPGCLRKLLLDAVMDTPMDSRTRLNVSIPQNLPPVVHAPHQIRIVIWNIILNAMESMPHGGTLTITASHQRFGVESNDTAPPLPDGDYVKIIIRDQGAGIPENHLPSIFDPYFTTKELGNRKGMGLGLATAYSIIRKHGGHIEADSKLGSGTAVFIYLPAVETG